MALYSCNEDIELLRKGNNLHADAYNDITYHQVALDSINQNNENSATFTFDNLNITKSSSETFISDWFYDRRDKNLRFYIAFEFNISKISNYKYTGTINLKIKPEQFINNEWCAMQARRTFLINCTSSYTYYNPEFPRQPIHVSYSEPLFHSGVGEKPADNMTYVMGCFAVDNKLTQDLEIKVKGSDGVERPCQIKDVAITVYSIEARRVSSYYLDIPDEMIVLHGIWRDINKTFKL